MLIIFIFSLIIVLTPNTQPLPSAWVFAKQNFDTWRFDRINEERRLLGKTPLRPKRYKKFQSKLWPAASSGSRSSTFWYLN
jgi:hypothetical protein